jgi:hypothetical protein
MLYVINFKAENIHTVTKNCPVTVKELISSDIKYCRKVTAGDYDDVMPFIAWKTLFLLFSLLLPSS